jgi:Protein of unknown function (DUF3072)
MVKLPCGKNISTTWFPYSIKEVPPLPASQEPLVVANPPILRICPRSVKIRQDLRNRQPRTDRNERRSYSNPEKPPEQWVTGEEPMPGPQISYLQTLCREAEEEFDPSLTKAEASKKIDELQARTGCGKSS